MILERDPAAMLSWLRPPAALVDRGGGGWSPPAGTLDSVRDSQMDLDHNYNVEGLTEYQLHVVRSVTLSVSCLSVVSALLASYFFLRMRRNFRHE